MTDVSHRVLRPILDEARLRGYPVATRCQECGFSDILEGSRGRVSWETFTALLERFCPLLGGPTHWEEFALRAATSIARPLLPVWITSPFPLFLLSVCWLGPGLFRCTRASLERIDGCRYLATIELLAGYRHSTYFFHLMAGAIASTPTLLGHPPAHVTLRMAPCIGQYEIRCVGARSASDRDNPDEIDSLEQLLDALLIGVPEKAAEDDDSAREQDLTTQVWRSLLRQQPSGPPDEAQVARQLGLSVRTLKRRLSERSTSYRKLRARALSILATRLLQQGLPSKKVADRLGYSDPAAFSRAFVRWTGTHPAALRPRTSFHRELARSV